MSNKAFEKPVIKNWYWEWCDFLYYKNKKRPVKSDVTDIKIPVIVEQLMNKRHIDFLKNK